MESAYFNIREESRLVMYPIQIFIVHFRIHILEISDYFINVFICLYQLSLN